MRYSTLRPHGIKISVVGIGTWVTGGENWGSVDDRQSIAAIETALDAGINLIDTAPSYGSGHAERVIGRAIKSRRDKIVIATKCGLRKKGKKYAISLKPADVRKDLEESLVQLGIEMVDLYQCHWPDTDTPVEETMEELFKLREEGKIRFIGVSNFDCLLVEKSLALAPLASIQSPYSLLERSIEESLLPFCRHQGLGVLTYGSLGGGILSGKYVQRPTLGKGDARTFFYRFYTEAIWEKINVLLSELCWVAEECEKPPAQVALNWVLQQQGIASALVGIRSPYQALVNAGTGDWELGDDHLHRLQAASDHVLGDKRTL